MEKEKEKRVNWQMKHSKHADRASRSRGRSRQYVMVASKPEDVGPFNQLLKIPSGAGVQCNLGPLQSTYKALLTMHGTPSPIILTTAE